MTIVGSSSGLKWLFLMLLFILPLLAGCGGGSAVSNDNLTPEQQATLSSYQLIDQINNPNLTNVTANVYEMTYSADYAFDQYLQTGSTDFSELKSFFIQYLFNQQPKTTASTSNSAYGCASFSAKDENGHVIFGRNWDHDFSDPVSVLVLHTKPSTGYASISLVYMPYCSDWGGPDALVTPYFIMDGMNEAGVAVSVMDTDDATLSPDPHKTTIWDCCALRLILDHAGTVNEAVTLLQQHNILWGFRVSSNETVPDPTHFMIADRSGDSVVIEYHQGQMRVIRSGKPWQVATNYNLDGKDPEDLSHCWRYKTAWTYLAGKNGVISNTEAMSVLGSITQDTFWSVVYDLESGDIQLAVAKNYQMIKTFHLNMLNSN